VITAVLFPAAPLPLIQDAVRKVFAALRDTLARLAELANTGGTADPQWALSTGQRIQRQLAGLQEASSAARQVASFAPRRWAERSRVRRAGEQTAPLHLLAATVLSLAHASTAAPAAGPAARPPHSLALREALAELTSAFAALAEGGGASAAHAAEHAIRARTLAANAEQTDDSHSQLMARLVETSSDDTLRFSRRLAAVCAPR
jgi:hypothetical protein